MDGWGPVALTGVICVVALVLAVLAVRGLWRSRSSTKDLVSVSLGGANAVDSGAFRLRESARPPAPPAAKPEQPDSASP